MFPGLSDSFPLPRRIVPPDFTARARACRRFDSSLFPEPFDRGRPPINAEGIPVGDFPEDVENTPSRCVEETVYEIVIEADGQVKDAKIVTARFADGPAGDPAAMAVEETALVPILRTWRLQPSTIRGAPVRSKTRGSFGRACPR